LDLRASMPPLRSRAIVNDLVPFFQLVGLFTLWLLFFVTVRWRTLHARRRAAIQPEPLEIERHAAFWKLAPQQVLARRDAKVS
ncbi:hypothetical protein MRO49_25735, partial [Escherichia coli]|uniref:hypothetical protein n=1 Tax=Escherichia coli TaxID=562 RepID=UPI002114A4F4